MGRTIDLDLAVNALQQEMKLHPCGSGEWFVLSSCLGKLVDLPSVTPDKKTGKWISHRPPDGFVLSLLSCDQCGYVNVGRSKFCPNCGADMRGE